MSTVFLTCVTNMNGTSRLILKVESRSVVMRSTWMAYYTFIGDIEAVFLYLKLFPNDLWMFVNLHDFLKSDYLNSQ